MEQRLQIAQVIQAGVGLALGLEGRRVPHHAPLGEGFTIHNRHHTGDAGTGANLRPLKGLHQGNREGEATGLDHDAVELIGTVQQRLHGGQEFILHGATETAVGQFHHPALELVPIVLRTDTAAADEVPVDPDLAKFIDEYRKPQAAGQQQMTQECGFAGTQKTGDHGDRKTRGAGTHLRARAATSRRRHQCR